MENLKPLAQNALNAIGNEYNEEKIRKYFTEDQIQHNPVVPTGMKGILGILPVLKKSRTVLKIHRVFQDGDIVVLHSTLDNAQAFGAKQVVLFDVYRMANGKIVEHWDAITPVVEKTASGRSQIDGPTQITDLDKTEENKAKVKALFDVIINGKQEEVGAAVMANFYPDYKQHSPVAADGIPAVFEAFGKEQWVYLKQHKVLGEGNFVLSISEGTAKGVPCAFYDLVRFENGKVAEHWDIIQEIPAQQAHTNGMF